MAVFTINGQVSSKPGKAGVAALTVEAVSSRGKNIYGTTLTARDGTYELSIEETRHPDLFKNSRAITLQFRDRDGKVVHRLKQTRKVKSGGRVRIDADLSADDLKRHCERPLFFADFGVHGSMRPARQINRSSQAITRIAAAGTNEFDLLNEILPCIEPPIGRFETILDDAIGTVGGDPLAASRFRDTLEELIQTVSESKSYRAVHSAVTARGNVYAGGSDSGSETGRRHEPVVDRDTGSLLLVAAMEAANGSRKLAEAYISVVAHQLGAYQRLAPLYEAGQRALLGGETGIRHFQSMLGSFERFCDPAIPNPDDVSDWEPGVLECSYQGLDDLVAPSITYVIEDVRAATACAGELIAISGQNFGTATTLSAMANRVRFTAEPADGNPNYIDVAAQSWSDTEVRVTVPDGAVAGPLSLRIRENIVPVCGHYHELYRRGNAFDFQGGSAPLIYFFTANGQEERLIIAPGEELTLSWSVEDTATDIRITGVALTGGTIPDELNLPPDGDLSITAAESPDRTLIVDFTLAATGPCGLRQRTVRVVVHQQARVFLTDMEVTQATQFLAANQHMAVNTAVMPDNSVALIQNKATLVRVYFSTDQDPAFNFGGSAPGLIIRLHGFRNGQALEGSPLAPLSEPLTALPDGTVTQRGTLNRSANFLLPSNWTSADEGVNLEAELSLSDASFDLLDDSRRRFFLEGVRFFAANPLDCVIVRVNYTGPQPPAGAGINGTTGVAPTLTAAAATVNAVRRMYPTDRIRLFIPPVVADRVITESAPLTVNNLVGISGWDNIILSLMGQAAGRTDDDNMVWCGVALAGIPLFFNAAGTGFIGGVGCGNCLFARGYATFRAISNGTPAHEIGHALNRPHHADDPDWAAQGPGRTGTGAGGIDSSGEFGVDVEAVAAGGGAVFNPATVNDFMESVNSGPRWISPYTYKKIMSDFLAPQAPDDASPAFSGNAETIEAAPRQRSEHLIVQGVLYPHEDRVELQPLCHMPRFPERRLPPRESSEYALLLVNEKNQTLASMPIVESRDRPLRREDEFGKPVENMVRFYANLPLVAGTVALEVYRGREQLARIEKSERKPRIGKLALSKSEKKWSLDWEAKHPNGLPLNFMVWITFDGGERWHRIDRGAKGRSFAFDPSELAGGKKCRLRLYVSDGFNTVYKDTAAFSLPLQPPDVLLLNFEDGKKVPARRLVLLEAVAISPRDGSLPPEKISWKSDKQGDLGTGEQIWVELKEGRHRLTVRGESAPDCVGKCTVSIDAYKQK